MWNMLLFKKEMFKITILKHEDPIEDMFIQIANLQEGQLLIPENTNFITWNQSRNMSLHNKIGYNTWKYTSTFIFNLMMLKDSTSSTAKISNFYFSIIYFSASLER